MERNNTTQQAGLAEEIDLKKIVQRIVRAWPWFGLSLAVWGALAFIFTVTYPPVYEAKTSVEIQEPQRIDDPSRMILGAQHFNEPDKYFFVNHQVKLSSYPVVSSAIAQLDFQVAYLQKGLFDQELYQQSPIRIELKEGMTFERSVTPYAVPFYVEILSDDRFYLEVDGEYDATGAPIELAGEYAFGDWINIDQIGFKVSRTEVKPVPGETYGFALVDLEELAFEYMEDMDVKRAELDASVFNVSLQGSPRQKTLDFIDMLGRTYVQQHLDEKNAVIDRTIAHIDRELDKVAGSLNQNELAVEQYKTGNGIVSLGQSGRLLLEQSASLEKERTNLEVKQQYFTYLRDFLKDDANLEKVISPQAFGINDPFLTNLINNLVKLQLDKKTLEAEGKVSHPAYAQLERNIELQKSNLLESVAGFETSNEIRKNAIADQIRKLEGESGQIPANELELLRLERMFALNESLYKNLMARKMEAEITRAATEPDVLIAEPAYITSVDPVFPSLPILGAVALLLGLMTPLGFMVVRSLFNSNVQTLEELQHLAAEVPVVSLAWSNIKTPSALQAFDRSQTAEEVKRVAVQLQQQSGAKMIGVHSGQASEGKSHVSVLLATTLALEGNRVLLVDADGRGDNVIQRFNKTTETATPGTVFETEVEHLCVRTFKLLSVEELKTLRNDYDYVVVDAPPCSLSSSAAQLLTAVDQNILVVRRNRSNYDNVEWMLEQAPLANASWHVCIFNDHQSIPYLLFRRNRYYIDKPKTFNERLKHLLRRA